MAFRVGEHNDEEKLKKKISIFLVFALTDSHVAPHLKAQLLSSLLSQLATHQQDQPPRQHWTQAQEEWLLAGLIGRAKMYLVDQSQDVDLEACVYNILILKHMLNAQFDVKLLHCGCIESIISDWTVQFRGFSTEMVRLVATENNGDWFRTLMYFVNVTELAKEVLRYARGLGIALEPSFADLLWSQVQHDEPFMQGWATQLVAVPNVTAHSFEVDDQKMDVVEDLFIEEGMKEVVKMNLENKPMNLFDDEQHADLKQDDFSTTDETSATDDDTESSDEDTASSVSDSFTTDEATDDEENIIEEDLPERPWSSLYYMGTEGVFQPVVVTNVN